MTDLEQMFIDSLPDNAAPEGEIALPPDVVEPNGADPGNVPPPPLIVPEPHYFSYQLDVSDTALTWSYGAPLDTGPIRQYLVDRGYVATAVEAAIDAAGLPTGIVTVRADAVPYTLTVAIDGTDESSAVDGATPATHIADTATQLLPNGYTYSGDVTFAAEMDRDSGTTDVTMVPVINCVAQTGVTAPFADIGWSQVTATITVTGLAGGTTPTFGMAYGGTTSGDTLRIRNATITGALTPDGSAVPAIDPAEWALYDGRRWTGIEQTIMTWSTTAEGAIVAKPDLARIAGFWLSLESNGIEVSQITGAWNFATPETAPASPQLAVYARGAIDPALIADYLYAAIDQAALDAFSVAWNAAISTSTMRRKVAGQVATPGQDDRGAPILWNQADEPVGDVREGDVWVAAGVNQRFTNGAWVNFPSGFSFSNESSTATGRQSLANDIFSTATGANAQATGPGSTATGAYSEALTASSTATGAYSKANGSNSTATGTSATVPDTSPRSIAIGAGAVVPASTPDTAVVRANDFRQVRSNSTGQTRHALQSPNGTLRYISITDTGLILVDGAPQNVPAVGSITSAMIADGTIVGADIADNTITSAKIADGTIVTADIADSAITSAKFAASAFPANHIKDEVIYTLGYIDTTVVSSPANVTAITATYDFGAGNWNGHLDFYGDAWRTVTTGGIRLRFRDGIIVMRDYYMGTKNGTWSSFFRKTGAAFAGLTGSHTFTVLFSGDSTAGTTVLNECELAVVAQRAA